MAVTVYWLVDQADQRMEDARLGQALGQARMLADGCRDALLVKDYAQIESLVQAAVPSEDYAYAMLSTPDGRILVHSDPSQVAHRTADLGRLQGPQSRRERYGGRPVLEVIYPANLINRHLANAHVAYYLDTPRFLAGFSPVLFILAPIGILLLLGGVTLLIVRRQVTDPLDRLIEVMAASSLQKQVRMPPVLLQREDELGSLARAFQDLSLRLHHSYQALARDEEALQTAVEQRTAQLRLANQELEAFSYSVSHDLRAPLRSIEGFTQAITESCGQALADDPCRDYFRRIQAACKRMGDLIDDLLQLSYLTRHELILQRVDLAQIALEIIEQLRANEPDRQIDIEVAQMPTVLADARLLRIALENLLNNAWKFTRDTSQARIEIGVEHKPPGLAFYVRDNGVGFDMQYSQQIFKPFQRLHSVEVFAGTGVGLAIVQRVIQRHDGQLWAEAKPNQGACFWFTLGKDPAAVALPI